MKTLNDVVEERLLEFQRNFPLAMIEFRQDGSGLDKMLEIRSFLRDSLKDIARLSFEGTRVEKKIHQKLSDIMGIATAEQEFDMITGFNRAIKEKTRKEEEFMNT